MQIFATKFTCTVLGIALAFGACKQRKNTESETAGAPGADSCFRPRPMNPSLSPALPDAGLYKTAKGDCEFILSHLPKPKIGGDFFLIKFNESPGCTNGGLVLKFRHYSSNSFQSECFAGKNKQGQLDSKKLNFYGAFTSGKTTFITNEYFTGASTQQPLGTQLFTKAAVESE